MEILCTLPIFFIFIVVAIYAQSHSRPGQSMGETEEDSLTMEDILLLEKMDDDADADDDES